jgi:hypothetical protein
MKILILSIFTLLISTFLSQEENNIKQTIVNTWRTCGLSSIDERDTLNFRPESGNCRYVDCGEHQWSFRASGVVEFMYTSGCDAGFSSKNESPQKYMYSAKTNLVKMISIDAYIIYFEVLKCNENELSLKRRRDLEI